MYSEGNRKSFSRALAWQARHDLLFQPSTRGWSLGKEKVSGSVTQRQTLEYTPVTTRTQTSFNFALRYTYLINNSWFHLKIKITEQLHSRILQLQPSNFLRCKINQCKCNLRQLHSWTQKVNSTENQASPHMTAHLSQNDQNQSSSNTTEICLLGKALTPINETTEKRVRSGSDDRPSK